MERADSQGDFTAPQHACIAAPYRTDDFSVLRGLLEDRHLSSLRGVRHYKRHLPWLRSIGLVDVDGSPTRKGTDFLAFVENEDTERRGAYVYVIHAIQSPFVKIGRTDTPALRLILLQTASPLSLQFLAVIPCGTPDQYYWDKYEVAKRVERDFLEQAAPYKHRPREVKCEWFRFPLGVEVVLRHHEIICRITLPSGACWCTEIGPTQNTAVDETPAPQDPPLSREAVA